MYLYYLYCMLVRFHPEYFSPFCYCKLFHPVLNSPENICFVQVERKKEICPVLDFLPTDYCGAWHENKTRVNISLHTESHVKAQTFQQVYSFS